MKTNLFHVSNERVLLVHIRNTKLMFCLFQQKENNVYNIYVTINVPFFKRDCTLHLFNSKSKHSFLLFFSSHILSHAFFHRGKVWGWTNSTGATEGNPVIFVVCVLDDYSGFRPNECFIVFNSFLKIIPVDPCSLYESTMNICFYF